MWKDKGNKIFVFIECTTQKKKINKKKERNAPVLFYLLHLEQFP